MNREDLKKYRDNQNWIKEQLQYFEEQRALVEKITQSFDGMPHAKNKLNYNFEKLMDSYNEMIKIINNEQEKLNVITKQLMEMQNTTYRNILTEMYKNGLDYAEILTIKDEKGRYIYNYSYSHLTHLHGYALNEFDKLDKDSKKKQDIANKK